MNVPEPGRYRLRVTGDAPGEFAVDVDFKREVAWPDPGQKPYNVSNLGFFDMLQEFVPADDKLVPASTDAVLSGAADLDKFDTVVAADDAFLPGYREPAAMDNAQPKIEDTFSCACAPGAGERTPATSGFYEFTIKPGNAGLDAKVTSETVVEPTCISSGSSRTGPTAATSRRVRPVAATLRPWPNRVLGGQGRVEHLRPPPGGERQPAWRRRG